MTRRSRMAVGSDLSKSKVHKVLPVSGKSVLHEEPESNDLHEWFLSFTTIGGLSHLHSTNWSLARVAWLLLFFLGVVLTSFNGYYVLTDYFDRQTMTRVMLENNDEIEFPAVTLCNYNRVHCGHLHEAILDMEQSEMKEHLCKIYSVGMCEVSIRYASETLYGMKDIDQVCTGNLSFDTLKQMDWGMAEMVYMGLVYTLPEEVQFAIAHQPEDLIRSCTFRQEVDITCMELMRGAHRFISPSTGVCYSFNSFINETEELRSQKVKKSSIVGEMYGLRLTIDIEARYNLLRGLTKNDGVKVVIHDPANPPAVCSQGYAVKPHTSTKVSLRQSYIKRQGHPYRSNCSNTWPRSFGPEVEQMPYDNHLCQSFCLDDIIQKGCNCTLPYILEVDRHLSPMCDFNNETVYACVEAQACQDNVGKLMFTDCQCPPRCEEVEFGVTLSSSKWPGDHFWPSLATQHNVSIMGMLLDERDFIKNLGEGLNTSYWEMFLALKEVVDTNFLEILIYYESTSVMQTVEEPKYTFMTFMSTIGGTLSLYLGVSFISLFEFVELGVRYAWSKHFSGGRR